MIQNLSSVSRSHRLSKEQDIAIYVNSHFKITVWRLNRSVGNPELERSPRGPGLRSLGDQRQALGLPGLQGNR